MKEVKFEGYKKINTSIENLFHWDNRSGIYLEFNGDGAKRISYTPIYANDKKIEIIIREVE